MAPSGKRIKARRRSSTTKPRRRRTHYKKLSKIQETPLDMAAATSATSSSIITYSKTIKRKTTTLIPNDSNSCSQTPEKKSVYDSNSCNQTQLENVSVVSPDRNGACSINGAHEVISSTTTGCSTPKGQRFRIPEILTCPRAPMKRRALQNCSVRRGPIAFFAPPDIELFFLFALGHVPAA
ncbi:cyclin-dependent protein kinase inhibitor SMR9 [Rhododendron vialii]|uniref:cyclin-dependent protein kinase inhibitor SMR9 n=1 Tax=Rhododendron vialii TaxID=182163 RepID=UPI00265D7EDE|nr:cyclin-dependent protein kinase inhibitor SMR9 [Rhododendron vialii]